MYLTAVKHDRLRATCGICQGFRRTMLRIDTVLGISDIGLRAGIGTGRQPERGEIKKPLSGDRGWKTGSWETCQPQEPDRTGTGTATAAATNRVGRGDGKTGTVSGINEIYLYGAAGVKQALIDQKC